MAQFKYAHITYIIQDVRSRCMQLYYSLYSIVAIQALPQVTQRLVF